MGHLPVMAEEIVSIFSKIPDGVFIDATIGLGGHTVCINEKLPGKFEIIGIDKDGEMLRLARENLNNSIRLFQGSFARIPEFLQKAEAGPVTGILFDLGLNSMQLDETSRGFSYRESAPLDLRYDRSAGSPCYQELSKANLPLLVSIFKEYGQEKRSRAIARAVLDERPKTTDALADIVRRISGGKGYLKSVSRIFQALRIYINNELAEIEDALNKAIPLLSSGGRIAAISYHSLEDRIVKNVFRKYSGKCTCGPGVGVCECGAMKVINIGTRKPLRPGPAEIRANSRARSARLRYAEKI